MKAQKVNGLVFESVYPKRFPDMVSRETGAKSVTVPYSVGAMGTKSYFDLIDRWVQGYLEALTMSEANVQERPNELIAFEHADLGYGKRTVLTDLNLVLSTGDFLGVVGPNGAGKTTILKAMLGILRPLGGQRAEGTRPSGSATCRSDNSWTRPIPSPPWKWPSWGAIHGWACSPGRACAIGSS